MLRRESRKAAARCRIGAAAGRVSAVFGLGVPLAAAAPATATPVPFDVLLVEDAGSEYTASFSIDSADLAAGNTWIESISDFVAEVDGVTYVWGIAVDDPQPFQGVAVYDDLSGDLIAIETPLLLAPGYDSLTNLRLLRDGTWTANTCIPLETCNPDYLFGTYSVQPSAIPEPAPIPLVLMGLAALGARSRVHRP